MLPTLQFAGQHAYFRLAFSLKCASGKRPYGCRWPCSIKLVMAAFKPERWLGFRW